LHFHDIISQVMPGVGAQQIDDIATLLQTPGRLLVTKLLGLASNSDQRPILLCVYTGASKQLAGYNFDPVTKHDCQMVFGLHPAHTVYHISLTNNTESALEIRAEAGVLLLGSGILKMEFTDRLRQLRFTTGSMTTEREVEELEIWTM
jgi:hypothetical protein